MKSSVSVMRVFFLAAFVSLVMINSACAFPIHLRTILDFPAPASGAIQEIPMSGVSNGGDVVDMINDDKDEEALRGYFDALNERIIREVLGKEEEEHGDGGEGENGKVAEEGKDKEGEGGLFVLSAETVKNVESRILMKRQELLKSQVGDMIPCSKQHGTRRVVILSLSSPSTPSSSPVVSFQCICAKGWAGEDCSQPVTA
eukprot:Nk52_evm52s210 gene=Nk52_evmTU52s210